MDERPSSVSAWRSVSSTTRRVSHRSSPSSVIIGAMRPVPNTDGGMLMLT